MTRKAQTKVVPSAWLLRNALRLDCGPYLSGAVEAQERLRLMPSAPLRDLTAGHAGGIYNGPQFVRNYVTDPRYGVPFLTTSTMLRADLSDVALLRRKDAESKKLKFLRLEEGTTLITCSGTIGRMAYVRPDMAGFWSNQDILKVVPNPDRVLPGYLYAFLSSRYGVPVVVGGTYGSIITHLEPDHIADLPVPRLGEVEREAHRLVSEAAELRARAASQLDEATQVLLRELSLPQDTGLDVSDFGVTSIRRFELEGRLDATYHSVAAHRASEALHKSPVPVRLLSQVTERLFKPPIFKRKWVDNAKYGRQFVSGNDAYLYKANEVRYVSDNTPGFDEFIAHRGWVLFQAAGQIYGLFGRPLFVHGWLESLFCADDLYRIVPKSEIDGAFIFLFLRTQYGQALIKRLASGYSIPRVWDPHMARLEVPWPDEKTRTSISSPVFMAKDAEWEALVKEGAAVTLVEEAIEGRTG